MSFNFVKTNILKFIISYVLLILFFFCTSYNFFLNDFLELENNQNKNNINSFLLSINKDIENLKNINNDYSKWDDTYEFAKTQNKEYIYENFREGSETLKGLDLNAIIYLNTKNKILFSKYENSYLKTHQNEFENYLIQNFKNKSISNSIINFNSKFLYLSKSKILKSDNTGKTTGSIITIKLITDDIFSKTHSIFSEIKISNNKSTDYDLNFSFPFIKNLKVKVNYLDTKISNTIMFFDKNEKHIISLITSNNRDIVINGKKTIYIFNLFVLIALFFVFYFIYKNQYLIENQNITLNNEVSRRTKQLDKAFRKLKTKNKELFTLANIDSLTKIKNRRRYFLESEVALKKAINHKKKLSILLIDIDHFKTINDTYGHAVGDTILISFAEIVSSVIDEKDIFGRIGGEEFCITFYNKDYDEVNKISEKIRINCENNKVNLNDNIIKYTVSMGLSSRENFTQIDKILHNADEFLYKAKKEGRNRLIRKL